MTIRQLRMLDALIQSRGASYDAALELNQNIFGSLCYRRWLIWEPRLEKFKVSPKGIEARSEINEWDLHRKMNNHKLARRARRVYRHHGLARVA